MRKTPFLVFSLLTPTILSAQASFDVASVREIVDPAVLQSIKSADIKLDSGNLYMHGITLGYAIQWAFDLTNPQLEGPEWIHWRPSNEQPRFEIIAKTAPNTLKPAVGVMLQKLLAERFGLKYHFEEKVRGTCVLRDDPHGLKIKRIERTDAKPLMTFVDGKLEFQNFDMKEFVSAISLTVKEPVVDRTTLGDQMFNASGTLIYERGTGEMVSALFATLRKDLGIVVSREKLPVKILVIDHIERRPSEN